MTEVIWVQLYIGKDKSGRAFKMEVDVKGDVDDLANAVYEANNNVLGHCNAAQLVVYKAGTELPPKEEDPLDPGEAVPTDTTSKNALRVLAPEQSKNVRVLTRRCFTNAKRLRFFP
jgi:hypothetical protein